MLSPTPFLKNCSFLEVISIIFLVARDSPVLVNILVAADRASVATLFLALRTFVYIDCLNYWLLCFVSFFRLIRRFVTSQHRATLENPRGVLCLVGSRDNTWPYSDKIRCVLTTALSRRIITSLRLLYKPGS